MADTRRVLRNEQGVTLTEFTLDGDRAYQVATLRTPEVWDFVSLTEAVGRYQDELGRSENDPFVQQRLARR